jgi:hypothetical protein
LKKIPPSAHFLLSWLLKLWVETRWPSHLFPIYLNLFSYFHSLSPFLSNVMNFFRCIFQFLNPQTKDSATYKLLSSSLSILFLFHWLFFTSKSSFGSFFLMTSFQCVLLKSQLI